MPSVSHEYVGGLDVAVNDSLGMRRIQCIRNLNPQLKHLLKRQRLACDTVLQRLAVQVLHDDEGLSVSSSISWMVQMLA